MTVRKARCADIPRIYALLIEAHGKSRYAGTEVQVDEKAVKALIVQAMQRHGGTNEGACLVLVSADDDHAAQGFIIAVLASIHEISKSLYATDLFFYQGENAIYGDAKQLLQGVVAWADTSSKVHEVRLGATDVVGDWERTQKLYTRMGFRQEGVIFQKRVT